MHATSCAVPKLNSDRGKRVDEVAPVLVAQPVPETLSVVATSMRESGKCWTAAARSPLSVRPAEIPCSLGLYASSLRTKKKDAREQGPGYLCLPLPIHQLQPLSRRRVRCLPARQHAWTSKGGNIRRFQERSYVFPAALLALRVGGACLHDRQPSPTVDSRGAARIDFPTPRSIKRPAALLPSFLSAAIRTVDPALLLKDTAVVACMQYSPACCCMQCTPSHARYVRGTMPGTSVTTPLLGKWVHDCLLFHAKPRAASVSGA